MRVKRQTRILPAPAQAQPWSQKEKVPVKKTVINISGGKGLDYYKSLILQAQKAKKAVDEHGDHDHCAHDHGDGGAACAKQKAEKAAKKLN